MEQEETRHAEPGIRPDPEPQPQPQPAEQPWATQPSASVPATDPIRTADPAVGGAPESLPAAGAPTLSVGSEPAPAAPAHVPSFAAEPQGTPQPAAPVEPLVPSPALEPTYRFEADTHAPEAEPVLPSFAAPDAAPDVRLESRVSPAPFYTTQDSAAPGVVPGPVPGAASPATPLGAPVQRPAEFGSVQQEASVQAAEVRSEPASTGPNWMLAFVCAWAGATALNEAWAVLAPVGWKAQILRNSAFLGYALLGLGLLVFAVEALRWGSRRRSGSTWVAVLVPALMTLAGIVALVMSQDPGRRI